MFIADTDTGADRIALSLWQRLVLTVLGCYAVLLFVTGIGQLTDPFIHYDDYPALLLREDLYYEKTLAEGRWFNWVWHLRGLATPSWVNFQLYLTGWSLFVGAATLAIFRSAPLRYPLLASALIVLAPQTTLITGWFNTLIPGLWLLAVYALISLFASPRTGRWLLLLFVPIAIQAYTPYPFLMLAICLMRQDRDRSFAELVRLTLTFITAFGLGMLVIFTINYQVFGVFGVELASWRNPTPAHDLAGYLANLPNLGDSLHWAWLMTGFGNPILSTLLFAGLAGSLVVIWRHDRLEVLAILVGMGSGLSLLALHSVQQGIMFPFRSTYFVWFLMIVAILRAAWLLEGSLPRRQTAPFALALFLALTIGASARIHHQGLSDWQAETRRIAAMIPPTTDMIYTYGTHLPLNGSGTARAEMPRDFSWRMMYLHPAETRMCSIAPQNCTDARPPFDPSATDDGFTLESRGGDTFIRLPLMVLPD